MARQKGPYKLIGTLGDITYVKNRHGYIAQEKTTLTGERIRTDIAFQRTREINAEFSRASKGGAVVRNSVKDLLQLAREGSVTSRMVARMFDVIHTDITS